MTVLKFTRVNSLQRPFQLKLAESLKTTCRGTVRINMSRFWPLVANTNTF